MNAFDSLSGELTQLLQEQGIEEPTPIQEDAIPTILSGKNALLLSPTGSGKTEAALLPLLNILYERSLDKELFGFYVLYITPLRALNRDVFRRIEELCEKLGITVDVRHGDTTQYQRRKQAIKPPNLLITTPETLQAILPGRRLRYHLQTVFAVVIDEVHELAGTKRGIQLSLGLGRLDSITDSNVQRIGLSATVGNPKEVAGLLETEVSKATIVWAGYRARRMNLNVEMPTPTSKDYELGRKIYYPAHSMARLRRIIDLIDNHKSTLVFTNTRSFTEVLGSKMRVLEPNFEFDVHHGSLSKEGRIEAEQRLKEGVSKGIIATSSLELGIDIGEADLVVQYSSPRQVSRGLQRIGRSGHTLEGIAKGIIIATVNVDDVLEAGVIFRRAKLNRVEEAKAPSHAWDVLCHQICGILLDREEVSVQDLLKFVRRSYAFKGVERKQLLELLRFMENKGYISLNDTSVSRGWKVLTFYYTHLSTIPDVQQSVVVDAATRAPVGVLDENYVSSLEPGHVFVIRGKPWEIISVEDEEIICAPAGGRQFEAPHWIGENIPVPYEVASEVSSVMNAIVSREERDARNWLKSSYGLENRAVEYVVEEMEQAKNELCQLPETKRLIVESFPGGLVLHAPFGTKTNDTLAILLSALLGTRVGGDIAAESDPYRVLLTADEKIDGGLVKDVFKDYTPEQVSAILEMALKKTRTLESRFIHVARRMGVIRRDAQITSLPVNRLMESMERTPVFAAAVAEVLQDKLDEKRTARIFEQVQDGFIEVMCLEREKPSSLANLIVETRTRFEVIGEVTEEREILNVMQHRLESKKVKLVCTNCTWHTIRTISTLESTIKCPTCESKMIAIGRPSSSRLEKALEKAHRGQELTSEDEKILEKANLTAILVANYGRKALITLAGRGIGPTTAARILRPSTMDRISLLREIAKAEKQYARTSQFW
ncbi:MAG: DEAD/DEAH box helicase [Candidatus Thorarchaeota archaeon]